MTEHIHKFQTTTKQNMLQCKCDTVIRLDVLLNNTATDAAKGARVALISRMLFGHELKKAAHDKYYAEVMAESSVVGHMKQESLL